MFFRKKIDGIEFGSEMARLFGRDAFRVIFRVDCLLQSQELDVTTYNPIASQIRAPVFLHIWIAAMCETVQYCLETWGGISETSARKLRKGAQDVLEAVGEKYDVQPDTRQLLEDEIHGIIVGDSEFLSGGILHHDDVLTSDIEIRDRSGVAYSVARSIFARCIAHLSDDEDADTIINLLASEFEMNHVTGAKICKQFRIK